MAGDMEWSCVSPRMPATVRNSVCVSPVLKKHCRSPRTPCTPTKPTWLQRCEDACATCPYPSVFALNQSSKREDRLTIDVRGADALWAVFDGHRRSDVSGHAAKEFPQLVWAHSEWPARPGEALSEALIECNEHAREEELVGGSTAVIVAACGSTIWCCSAGDSRAVAGLRNGGVHRMSVDHTCDRPEEIERVKATGGRISWGRLGGLPMTRGLGNFHLEAEGFACLPQVGSVPRWEVDFVVVASDGLWDVVSDDECCALIRSWGTDGFNSAADALTARARSLGSNDDIAVIVIGFPPEGAVGAAGA